MERAGGKDRGTLSQWRGRKIIAEMVEAKVMEVPDGDHHLGPPNHQLAGWEMKNAAVRNNQIQLDVAPLILINPTTPLPYFLIITIAILLEWHIPKKIYLKKPLLDQNTKSSSLTLDTTNAAQIFHLLQKVCFLCKFVRVGNSEIVGRAT